MRNTRQSLGCSRSGTIIFALLISACSGTDNPGPQSRFTPLINAMEAERASLNVPGVAVAIVEKGEVTFAQGFGRKDLQHTDPVEPTTLFRIGSCTKGLTSVAVLQAVQSGLADLDAPVTTYVPNFHLNRSQDAVANLKVRHLLSQTSGLADLGFQANAPADEQTEAGLESYLTGRFADIDYIGAPPGAVWAYANPNYMLAGLVAEKATGVTYRTLMHDQVFAPLGMSRTYFSASDVLADGDYAVGENCTTSGASGCNPGGDEPEVIEPDTYDNPWASAAGYAWSSVLDMAEFTNFLIHGQADVLSDELRNQMTSAQASTREVGDVVSYGFGIGVASGFFIGSRFEPLKLIAHDGGIPGFSSIYYCVPSLDFCFIALANANDVFFPQSFVTAFNTLTNHPPMTAVPDVAPQPTRFAAYAGTYNELTLGTLNVTVNNGNLNVQIPSLDADQTPYTPQLTPTTVDNFIATVGGAQWPLTFFADSSGTYRYVVARPYVATRSGG
jgi:CubicO group peptidase (beta-lactamase class C family)